MRLPTLIVSLLFLASVFAGYLYIVQERVGTGTKCMLNWAHGDSAYNSGPASCWAPLPDNVAYFDTVLYDNFLGY